MIHSIKISGDFSRNIFTDKDLSIGAKLLYLYYYKLHYVFDTKFHPKQIAKDLNIKIRRYYRYKSELVKQGIINKERAKDITLNTNRKK